MMRPPPRQSAPAEVAERSPVGKRIEAARKARPHHEFPVERYFSLGAEVAKVAIRVATSREQDMALAAAHDYVVRMAGKSDSAKSDVDLIHDAKASAIVASVVRDPTTPDMMPVWPTVDVVKEDLSSDQLGVLLRLVNEVRARFGPVDSELDDGKVEALAGMAAALAESNLPDDLLTPLPHPTLVQLYILTAVKLRDARDDLELLSYVDGAALEAARAALAESKAAATVAVADKP
jgi:hypothetical protein